MNTTDRIKAYLEYRNIPVSRAEKACGMGNATIATAFKRQASIGSDNLEKFLNTYSEVSAEWLLRGAGSMLLDESAAPSYETEQNKYFLLCKMLLENRQRDNDLYSELARLMLQ